jgi:hypothetical protein
MVMSIAFAFRRSSGDKEMRAIREDGSFSHCLLTPPTAGASFRHDFFCLFHGNPVDSADFDGGQSAASNQIAKVGMSDIQNFCQLREAHVAR